MKRSMGVFNDTNSDLSFKISTTIAAIHLSKQTTFNISTFSFRGNLFP